MKKSIFIAVLGVAAVAASSYGQGYIVFSTYASNGGVGNIAETLVGSTPLGSTYTASLYYALGTVADPVSQTAPSITSPVSGAFTLYTGANNSFAFDNSGSAVGTAGLGYVDGGLVTIPGYTSGAISFELVATGPSEHGRSGAWTESSIVSSASLPPGYFGDNGTAPAFYVASVPEPTSLALASLGGLASLVALRRRKQA
jgi:hypothetical protein